MANLKIFAFVLFFHFNLSKSLECISCSSEKDKQCADLLEFNYTSSGSASIQLIDCSDEAVRRQFIEYFSNLLSVLGVPVESSAKSNRQVSKNEEKPQACQKVVLNHESSQIVIRDCAVLSEISCDSLKNQAELYISFCDVCHTDYCNYSTKSVTNWNLVIMVALTSAIFNNQRFQIYC